MLTLALVACGGPSGGSGGSGGDGGVPQSCGFAACPQDLACEDDPRDNCDPAMGGADCPGACFSCLASAACTKGGVQCGDHCCNVGEWCDTVFSPAPTCKCGRNAGCTGGNHCAAPGPGGPSGCGSICCGTQGAPCPR